MITPLFGLFDFIWTSSPWILWGFLALFAFIVVKLLLDRRSNAAAAAAGLPAPAPSLSGFNFGAAPVVPRATLAPKANPFDVQTSLEELVNVCGLWGLTDLAIVLNHLAAGDESEAHRSIREIAIKLRQPRYLTSLSKPVILRHLLELKDDPEVAKAIAAAK